MAATLALTAGTVALAMAALWVVSVVRRDASVVDPFWGMGFVLAAALAGWRHAPLGPRAWLLLGLTTVWGLRLSLHLLRRNWGHGEDRRYAAMRTRNGPRFVWISLFTVFLLQAAILWFVALPVTVALAENAGGAWGMLDALGLALFGVGLFFEAVGDWQLERFRADPANAGRALDRGLWRYTRHPNYFGDACVWWGLYLIAAAGGAWWTAFSPLAMTMLLLKVSGVALLESDIAERRPGYAAYRARTNAFFPGPPRA